MANNDYGGTMRVTLSGGTNLDLRATFTIMSSGRSVEPIVNQSGTVDRVSSLTAFRAEISFADRGSDYAALMAAERFDGTFIEEDNGVTHYFTRAFLTGEPSVNRMTGEVTGLTLVAEGYSRKG